MGGQGLGQTLGMDRFRRFRERDRLHGGTFSELGALRPGRQSGVEQIPGGFRLGKQLLRQPHPERALEAQQ
jgi:hypothetical protein